MGQFASTNLNIRRGDAGGGGGTPLTPSVREARHVAALLVSGKKIPVELAIDILNLADYVPTMSTKSTRPFNVQAGWSGNRQSIAILQTPAIPSIPNVRDDLAVERIRVFTDSHDQGFSSFPEFQNTREASSSWFELALVRSSQPSSTPTASRTSPSDVAMPGSLPTLQDETSPPAVRPFATLPTLETVRRIRLYANLHANRGFNPFSITLEKRKEEDISHRARDGTEREEEDEQEQQDELMRAVRPGDRLVLYALAQYPAWSNVVRQCRIDVGMKAL